MKAARKKALKKGSLIGEWIIEEELTYAGTHGSGQTLLAKRDRRTQALAGYAISNAHFPSDRFAIHGEPGEWQLQKVEKVDWAMTSGQPTQRLYFLSGRILKQAETIPPLVEGL